MAKLTLVRVVNRHEWLEVTLEAERRELRFGDKGMEESMQITMVIQNKGIADAVDEAFRMVGRFGADLAKNYEHYPSPENGEG